MRAFLWLVLLAGCGSEARADAQAGLAPTVSEPTRIEAPARSEQWERVSKAQPTACPEEMVAIGRYCIDRYEAHLLELTDDGSLVRHPHNQRPEAGGFWLAASAPGVSPQAYISRQEAERACQAADKRLCTRGEWQRACMGSRGKTYPYGWRRRQGICNTGKEHLLSVRFGGGPWDYQQFNDPALDAEPGFLAIGGDYERCASDDGVYDLVGNLHEWVSGRVSESFVAAIEHEPVTRNEQPWVVGNGIFMGGFYSTTDQLGAGCYYTTIAHEPTYHDYSTGFRCCADAP